MNIGQIIKLDCANGPGLRLSVFVSGCNNHCEGCFQPETWDFNYGQPYTKETEDFIITELSIPYYKGITFLGGDPFELSNQKELLPLILKIRKTLPNKDIWMYTGYTYEKDLKKGGKQYLKNVTDEILNNIDILVDGKFIQELKNISLNYRGSENQRIIDVKKSIKNRTIILSSLN